MKKNEGSELVIREECAKEHRKRGERGKGEQIHEKWDGEVAPTSVTTCSDQMIIKGSEK